MSTFVPVKKNDPAGWIGYISLAPLTATGAWQANPTLASGDVKISGDGGSLANLGTLPAVTPAGSKIVKITLSQAETNYDNIVIIFSDQTNPAEWCDLTVHLQTVARQLDDLTFPNTSGRGMDVDASGGVEVGSFQANAITSAAINDGAFTAAKFADSFLTAAKIASDAIAAAKIADGAFTAAKFASGAFDAVWSVATRLLTAGTNIVLAKGAGVTGFNDLSAAQVNAEADTALSDVGLTSTVTGRVDAAVSTRLASASYTAPPSAATIASAVWDSLTSALTTVGSIGKLLIDNVNATISSRLASSSYTAPDNSSITSIKSKTDSLTFSAANKVDSNVKSVNGVTVTGVGSEADPWGP